MGKDINWNSEAVNSPEFMQALKMEGLDYSNPMTHSSVGGNTAPPPMNNTSFQAALAADPAKMAEFRKALAASPEFREHYKRQQKMKSPAMQNKGVNRRPAPTINPNAQTNLAAALRGKGSASLQPYGGAGLTPDVLHKANTKPFRDELAANPEKMAQFREHLASNPAAREGIGNNMRNRHRRATQTGAGLSPGVQNTNTAGDSNG